MKYCVKILMLIMLGGIQLEARYKSRYIDLDKKKQELLDEVDIIDNYVDGYLTVFIDTIETKDEQMTSLKGMNIRMARLMELKEKALRFPQDMRPQLMINRIKVVMFKLKRAKNRLRNLPV